MCVEHREWRSAREKLMLLKKGSPVKKKKKKKSLPAVQETRVQSLGQEDPLKEEKATHSSVLAWKIPWTKEPGRLQPIGLQRGGHD